MGALMLDEIVEDAEEYRVQDAAVILQLDYSGSAHVVRPDYSIQAIISSKDTFKIPLIEPPSDDNLMAPIMRLIAAVVLSRKPTITMGSYADIDLREELRRVDGRGWSLPSIMIADPMVYLPRWVKTSKADDVPEGWLIGLARLSTSKPIVLVRVADGRIGLVARSTRIAGVKVLP